MEILVDLSFHDEYLHKIHKINIKYYVVLYHYIMKKSIYKEK